MVRLRPSRVALIALIALTSAASHVAAQPLADRLPPQTLVYAGWSPGASLQTTLPAKMLADERFIRPWRLMLQETVFAMPDAIAPVAGGRLSENLPQLLTDAAQCEGAAALLDLSRAGRGWKVQAVLVINLGAKRKSFEEHFKPIHDRLKERLGDRLHMMKLENSWLWSKTTNDVADYTWGFLGDSFVFYFGDDGAKFLPTLSAAKPAQSLKNAPNFADTMSKIPGDATLTTYVDLSRGLKLGQAALKDSRSSDWAMAALLWEKTTLALGVDNALALGQKTSIQDEQFVTQSLLRTDGPPHGLLAQLVQPAVDDAMLKAVPADAMGVLAVRLDLSKFYDAIKAAATTVAGEDAKKSFDAFEQEAASRGIAVTQLFAPLGEQWVFYNATSTGGFPFLGLTAVVDIRDGEKLHLVLAAVEKLLGAIAGADGARLRNYEADGLTVRYLQTGGGFQLITPAYAVVGDKLIIALYPQLVEDAAKQAAGGGKSLLDRPEFVDRRKQTGGGGPLLYLSEPEVVKAIYPLALPFITAVRGFEGTGEGGAGMALDLIPSMRRVLSYLGDEALSVRLTPDGIAATRSVANPMLSPLTVLDAVPFLVPFTLDTVGELDRTAKRVKSAENLKAISQGMTLYANDHNGKFPPDLQTLVKGDYVTAATLSSPFGNGATQDYKYLYFDGINSTLPADVVIAYDAVGDADGGREVLYGDGHIDLVSREEMEATMKKSEESRKQIKPATK